MKPLKIKEIYVIASGYIYLDCLATTNKGNYLISNQDNGGEWKTTIEKVSREKTKEILKSAEIEKIEVREWDPNEFIKENKSSFFNITNKKVKIIYLQNYLCI